MNKPDTSTKHLLEKVGLKQPSPGFTAGVMDAIAAEESASFEYKPLFSTKQWIAAAVLLVGIIGTILVVPGQEVATDTPHWSGWLNTLLLRAYETLANLHIPAPVLWGFLGLGSLYLIEMLFLRRSLRASYTL